MFIQIMKNETDQIWQNTLKKVYTYWFLKTTMECNDT